MVQWVSIEIADAMELLSPDFRNEEVGVVCQLSSAASQAGSLPAGCMTPNHHCASTFF